MRFLVLVILVFDWSRLLGVIDAMQQLRPNIQKTSPSNPSHNYETIRNQHQEPHERLISPSRRNVLCSIAAGVSTTVLADCSRQNANAATSTTAPKTFRAYQVQPDSGEKLNPTLITLTVTS